MLPEDYDLVFIDGTNNVYHRSGMRICRYLSETYESEMLFIFQVSDHHYVIDRKCKWKRNLCFCEGKLTTHLPPPKTGFALVERSDKMVKEHVSVTYFDYEEITPEYLRKERAKYLASEMSAIQSKIHEIDEKLKEFDEKINKALHGDKPAPTSEDLDKLP